jgi:hypothetical protein
LKLSSPEADVQEVQKQFEESQENHITDESKDNMPNIEETKGQPID